MRQQLKSFFAWRHKRVTDTHTHKCVGTSPTAGRLQLSYTRGEQNVWLSASTVVRKGKKQIKRQNLRCFSYTWPELIRKKIIILLRTFCFYQHLTHWHNKDLHNIRKITVFTLHSIEISKIPQLHVYHVLIRFYWRDRQNMKLLPDIPDVNKPHFNNCSKKKVRHPGINNWNERLN